ncbi:phosphatase PAP2 family protein [Sulfurimonas autotrophica]|uniref:Phosphoesterase PA-phosphatase related protein n=1 Tax=Sulfurimonas autotrophica (strain ATCC BAA-671 / DSM 16294 / JCM 11897 / OK10) TaxID=563040 RepID=E0UPJ7_SULAO|nr:phosphatase PAP2 family protein [Sulfurimonas autotrophica]ADN09727.1 phosphoesterase PA-phosphatase related protein [Sulfurimonas autotrophica DSM 16294]
MKKFIISIAILLEMSNWLYAKSATESIGDILSIAIPAGAYGTSLYLGDKDGQMQFYKSFGSTMAATYILKYTVREKRPDSNNKDSFPSGHISSAFAGASFIHKRYGLKYAILPYIAAAYTGYSRVHVNRHHPIDVYAGAALGILSSWYFVTPYKNLQVTPIVGSDFKGLSLSYKW